MEKSTHPILNITNSMTHKIAVDRYTSKGRKLIKEVGDVLVTTAKAAEDMKFSADEIAAIKKEATEAIEAYKELRKKPDAEPEPGG